MMHVSEIEIEFASKLAEIWDDREFIIGMLSIVEHNDDMRRII